MEAVERNLKSKSGLLLLEAAAMEETARYGIFGWPLLSTLSPKMHMRAFWLSKIRASYEVFPCQDAGMILERAEDLNLSGFNVTVPHKIEIMDRLDSVDKISEMSGSVNAVKRDGNKFFGRNFDVSGFADSLQESIDPDGGKFIIIGSGGSARSIYCALAGFNAERIAIAARDIKKAERLHEYFDGYFPKVQKTAMKTDRLCLSEFSDCTAVVNCTPCSMAGFDPESPIEIPRQTSADCLVYDLVYMPQRTELLKQAEAMNLKTASGLRMLILQGLYSFQWWTGRTFDADLMETFLSADITA